MKKKAKESGYIPNKLARNLSSKSTNSIGIVVSKINEPFTSYLLDELFNKMYKFDIDIYLRTFKETKEDINKIVRNLLALRVETLVILAPSGEVNLSFLENAHNNGKNIILLNSNQARNGFGNIKIDFDYVYEKILMNARESKCKFISYLAGNNGIDTGSYQLDRFEIAIEKTGVNRRNIMLFNTDKEMNNYDLLINQLKKFHSDCICLFSNLNNMYEFLNVATAELGTDFWNENKLICLQSTDEFKYVSIPVVSPIYPINSITDYIIAKHSENKNNRSDTKELIIRPTI